MLHGARRTPGAATVESIVVLLGYTGVAIALTWPRAQILSEGLPRSLLIMDTWLVAWMQAYIGHALVHSPGELLGGNIYHPSPHALFYGPTHFGAAPLLAPLQGFFGNAALTFNTLGILNLSLTAASIHLVLQRWTGSATAGLTGAAFFLLSPLVANYATFLPGYLTLGYLPWILYLCLRTPRSLPGILGLGLLIGLQCLVGPLYLMPGVAGPLFLLLVWRLLRSKTRADGLRLLAASAVGALLSLPVYASYAAVFTSVPNMETSTFWENGDTDPMEGFLDGGGLLLDQLTSLLSFGWPATILLLAGALWLAMHSRRSDGPDIARPFALGAFWLVVVDTLCMGHDASIGGVEFPLPLGLLSTAAPILERLRNLRRLSILAEVLIALLVGLGFASFRDLLGRLGASHWRRTASGALATLFVALFALSNSGTLMQEREYGAPPTMDPILRTTMGLFPGAPVLVLPVHALGKSRSVGSLRHARTQYESTEHWHPILNGYSGYYPPGFPRRMELAERLPDPDALAALARETGLGLILVRSTVLGPWRPIATGQASRPDLTLLARTRSGYLFRVEPSGFPADTHEALQNEGSRPDTEGAEASLHEGAPGFD